MAANVYEIVWRNPLPIWARPIEQAAGSFELVKTPEPHRRQWSIGSFVFYCSPPRIGVAKLHIRKNRKTTAFTSSAVAVTAVDSGERCTR